MEKLLTRDDVIRAGACADGVYEWASDLRLTAAPVSLLLRRADEIEADYIQRAADLSGSGDGSKYGDEDGYGYGEDGWYGYGAGPGYGDGYGQPGYGEGYGYGDGPASGSRSPRTGSAWPGSRSEDKDGYGYGWSGYGYGYGSVFGDGGEDG